MKEVTIKQAKEFVRDYAGTLKAKGLQNEFRSVKEIARIMGTDASTVTHFVLVAEQNKFMYGDNMELPSYINFPTLFKVCE